MNKLLYILFSSIFLLDYLSIHLGLLGRYATWLPEIISILTVLIVSAQFMLVSGKNIPPKCAVFIFLFLLNIIIGIVINIVPTGPLIAGLRTYLKFIPFFILPFVYHFSNQQINGQLKFVLFLFILQSPIALYQRIVETNAKGVITGDLVTGTLSTSGQLTVALCCAIAVLMSFYLAKRISIERFLIIFSLLFIPMTLNETKATIILLPMSLMLPMFFSSENVKIKQFIPIITISILTGIAFIFIYDSLMRPRWGYGLLDFLTMEGRAESYLYSGDEAVSGLKNVGKIDSYVFAVKKLSENILDLLFGLGIGNVSESFIPSLSGTYAKKYSVFGVKTTSLSLILWEIGLLGAILYYAFYYIVFKDSRYLTLHGGLAGILASGWSVVSVLMMLSTAYTNVIQENVTSYLFWYFSGYIISEQFRYKRMSLQSS